MSQSDFARILDSLVSFLTVRFSPEQYTLLFRTLDAFRVFDSIFIMTKGAQNTESVSIVGYQQLLSRLNLGLGSAVSVLIFLLVLMIATAFVKGFGTAVPKGS